MGRWLIVALLTVGPGTAFAQRIDRVSFEGNRRVEQQTLYATVVSRPGSELDVGKVQLDIRALWRTGWFEDVRAELRDGVELVFLLDERPVVRKVLVDGNRGVKLSDINEVLDLKRDAILDPTAVARNRDKLRVLCEKQGYPLAVVREDVRPVDGDSVDVWFLIEERGKIEVKQVDFLGNEAIDDGELRRVMTMGDTYDPAALERDVVRVAAYYFDKGHARVRVGEPRVRLSRDRRNMYVTIPVDEGPVFSFGRVAVSGDQPVGLELQSVEGNRVSRSAVAGDYERIANHFRDRGYAYVVVDPRQSFDLDNDRMEVSFAVNKGARVYVERINIRGAGKTRDKVIRRELKLSEGELYSQTAIDRSRRRVMALGYFGAVNVSTRRGSSDDMIEVEIEVSERPTGTFQMGAGFSSFDGIMGQANIAWKNFLGRGQTVELSALVSGARTRFNLRFAEPYFLDTDWSFAFDAFRTSRRLGEVDRESFGGALTWGRKLSDHTRTFVTYTLEDVGVSDPGSVANLYRGGVNSSMRGTSQYDTRNNRLFPTDGQFHSVFAEIADSFTGSENVFVRYGATARYYKPVWGGLVLRLRGQAGVVTSRDPLGVPIT